MRAPLARLRGIVRRFGPVTALAGADLEIRPGEVHGVLGENGAGKSTLLGVLGGMIRPDGGTVEVGGAPVVLSSPRDAWAHGVGLVHQHFTLVPALTVLENLLLGRRGGGAGLRLPHEEMRAEVGELMVRTGLDVPLDARVGDVGVGDRQRLEILKALLREPPLLALDEPTAVLAPREVDALFDLLRRVARENRAVVLVAHKIDEVLAVADRVTVLRAGRTVLSARTHEVERASLIREMVGGDRDVTEVDRHRRADSLAGDVPVARLDTVGARNARGALAVRHVSLDVRRDEIVGIAGIEGNGQRELALVLAGRARPETGSVDLPRCVGFIPQDRTREGVIAGFDLVDNMALGLHDDPTAGGGPFMPWVEIRRRTEEVMSRFGVRAPGVQTLAARLSGGNQQRLVVGRELLRATDLLVAENPTRGLDVRATHFVRRELVRLTEGRSGPGIVLLSTDLDEVLALSDRVFVMVRGRLIAVPAHRRTREGVGALMLSGGDEAA